MTRMLVRGLIGVALVEACGGGDGNHPQIQPALAIIAGDAQSDTVGKTLATSLQVKLTDANSGAPLSGYVVNWSADRGSLFAPVTQTGVSGTTSNVFTLGTLATIQHVVAKYIDPQSGTPVTTDTITATALPALAAAIFLDPGVTRWPLGVHVGDTTIYTVNFRDSYGNDGAPCVSGVAWASLTWVYDTSLVHLASTYNTGAGIATRFAAARTGGAQFTVTTACSMSVPTLSTQYSLAIDP